MTSSDKWYPKLTKWVTLSAMNMTNAIKFQAKISIDRGWSWNIGQTTLMDGSDNPQIPSGED
jgi:hypothetical protein